MHPVRVSSCSNVPDPIPNPYLLGLPLTKPNRSNSPNQLGLMSSVRFGPVRVGRVHGSTTPMTTPSLLSWKWQFWFQVGSLALFWIELNWIFTINVSRPLFLFLVNECSLSPDKYTICSHCNLYSPWLDLANISFVWKKCVVGSQWHCIGLFVNSWLEICLFVTIHEYCP